MSKIAPCLWFDGDAEEAAKFYVSILPDSRIDHVQRNVIDSPGGKAGTVLVVAFTLAGQPGSATPDRLALSRASPPIRQRPSLVVLSDTGGRSPLVRPRRENVRWPGMLFDGSDGRGLHHRPALGALHAGGSRHLAHPVRAVSSTSSKAMSARNTLDGLAGARNRLRRRAEFRAHECQPAPTDRLGSGGGSRADPVAALLPDAGQPPVPGRDLHPQPRAARLSRGARHLPRCLRPRAASDQPGLCRLHERIRPHRARRRRA